MNRIIVGLVAQKQHGKDTYAEGLSVAGFERVAFADPLKAAAKLIWRLSDEQLHGAEKETPDERWDGLTARHFLQVLGTEAGRHAHPETWIRSALLTIDSLPAGVPVVVTDVRFPNEFEALKTRGATMVGITRAGMPTGDTHASESQIPDLVQACDILVRNDGARQSLVDLGALQGMNLRHGGMLG